MISRIPLYLDFAAGEVKELTNTDVLAREFLQDAKLYSYDGTGSEGFTWTDSNLTGKTVIGVFRAGSFKRRISGMPSGTSEEIGVDGTTVTLQEGDALVVGEHLDFLYYEST